MGEWETGRGGDLVKGDWVTRGKVTWGRGKGKGFRFRVSGGENEWSVGVMGLLDSIIPAEVNVRFHSLGTASEPGPPPRVGSKMVSNSLFIVSA